MADLGISVAAKLIEVLTGESINHILDMWGYKAELEDLKKTVSFIRNVLVDADREAAIRKLSRQEEDYIEELKYAVYDVDDVFDEFQTLAELKQLGDLSKVGKLMDKVNRFFSSKNQIGEAYRMSSEVTNIRNKLKTIADHKKFKFKNVNHEFNRREETCSILKTMQVIGRENDKKMIIDMLLDHQNVGENVSFVTIFGEGGLGKTVLAQFVYDDEKIKNEFKHDNEKTIKNGFSGDFRLWVCVGDLDKEKFDVKAILCKIIELVNKESVDVNKSLELVQRQFQENFRDKKYFLVLDDVWSEDCNKWDSLKNVLRFCARGSRVLVTTRSEKTAKMIGWKHVHKLGGLSEDNAWHLFKGLAFEERDETHQELVEIGKKIVHKFHGNPLALSVLGSYLSGADIDKWRTIEEFGFVGLSRNDGDKIFSTLRFSYDNLEPRLKNCFSYFALFRKDFRIEKERLISLWIAQGYIVPDKGQSFDDAAEEHFVTLLQRRFFEIELGSPFNLIKVHDFMHDLAQDVRKNEIVNSLNSNLLADQVRHVRNTCLDSLRCSPKIRSYIGKFHKDVDIGNWKYLRVLDLSYSKFKSLPKSIGKLLLLRYLDLSYNDELYALSNEITKLHNLQTLLLSGCSSIREFPKGSGKLIKLRHLDLGRCRKFVKEGPLMDVLLVNWRYLGVLNMSGLNGESLSISIGKLMHLRHLDLSENVYLKAVPDEISELCNLQSLLLRNCYHLRCLPKDFSKLSKLRQFDLDDCISLTCMPLGMEKLTSLTFLPYFVVGRRNSAKMDCDDELKVLKPLTKVKGSIKIVIGEYYRKVESLDDIEEGYLRRIEHLEEVDLKFDFACENPKAALETLKPHSNLKKLKLSSYRGTTIPWGRAKDNWAISLSGLVSISLKDCTHLQEMPMLSKLPHLKRLNLEKLDRLEFMETSSNDTEREELPMFFPSLEYLEIRSISELKGWWEGKPSWVDYDYHSKKILRFSCLVELRISSCMKLTSFPQCPRLEALELSANNETLKIRTDEEEEVLLRELTIGDLGILKSLPISRLTKLIVKTRGRRLYYTKGVDDLSQEFSRCASFLKSLSIEDMDVLRILSGRKGFHNFTALESLNIAVSATMYVEYEDDDIFWKSLSQNLRILNFESGSRMKDGLPKGFRYLTSLQTLQLECGDGVKAIPEWIDCLSSLQYLSIRDCPELKSLPEKMKKLDSLKSLEIKSCPKLEERCRKPDGADWPKIRHIPNIQINNTKIQ